MHQGERQMDSRLRGNDGGSGSRKKWGDPRLCPCLPVAPPLTSCASRALAALYSFPLAGPPARHRKTRHTMGLLQAVAGSIGGTLADQRTMGPE